MNEKSTKILLFTTAFKPLIGGSEIAIESIAKNLPDILFDIITPRYSQEYASLENEGNIRIYRVGLGSKMDKFFFPLSGYWLASRLVKTNEYHMIHAYQASYGGLAAFLFKIFNPIMPFILTLQEGKDLDRQNFLVKFLRGTIIKKADKVTVISSYLAQYVGRYTKSPATIIPNGVNLLIFNPALYDNPVKNNLRQVLGIASEDKIIVTTSRLVAKNGISHIIENADQLLSRIPSIKFLIIGDGPLWQQLRDQTLNTQARDKIIFTGAIEHHMLPLYLTISHLFVRPSETEGLGNSFLEAMAMGLPVLATPVGGIIDFIEDNKTGFIWHREKETLGQKMTEILENPQLTEEIARNGQRLIQERYNWVEVSVKFRQIYEGLYESKI